ncbi:MAG: N-acetylmuramoyl-L-alanine amidase, partial [bacterium]
MAAGRGDRGSRTLCLAACLSVLLAGSCLARTGVVVYSDGRPSDKAEVLERDGKAYLGVSEVARLLGLEKAIDLEKGRAILAYGGREVEIPVGGTVWKIDQQTLACDEPAFLEGDQIYVGLASAERLLAESFGKSLRWDQGRGRLTVGLPAPNIIDMEVRSEPDRVIAVIKTIGILRYDLVPAEEGRIDILIRGGSFSKQMGFEAPGGLIERVEADQQPEGARIMVTLGSVKPAYRVFPQWDPSGIVVKVWTRALTEIPEPELRPPRRVAWQERFSEDKVALDVIVVDPGHGGSNRGSIGATGYLEKEFNLAVARKLKSALERDGLEVILTRSDDILVPLETRTELANSVGADMFISIHANGFASKEAGGFEVYFLSPPVDETARYLVAAENGDIQPAPFLSEGEDDVAFILWDAAQSEFVAESSYLAQLVNEEIARFARIPNRGVKQADFFV